MSLPRALCGPVRAMARPTRPPAEIAAVKAAAAIVRAETGLTAAEPVARVIAARVIAALIADLERDADNALAEALAAVEQRLFASPFVVLATCPDIDTASLLVARSAALIHQLGGRFPTEKEGKAHIAKSCDEIAITLSCRYTKHVRKCV